MRRIMRSYAFRFCISSVPDHLILPIVTPTSVEVETAERGMVRIPVFLGVESWVKAVIQAAGNAFRIRA